MGFGGWRREKKLYKQWEKYANLSPEAIPQKETPADKDKQRLKVLYTLLGVSIVLFCAGLILILIKSC